MKIAVLNNALAADFETCCAIMKETGVDGVEIQNVDNTPVEHLTPAHAEAWKTVCDRYGITPVGLTTHAFGGVPVTAVERGDPLYEKHFALLKNSFAMAKIMGAGFVRSQTFTKAIVTWGSRGADYWMAMGNAAWPKFIKLFEPVVRLAEDEGVDLMVETCFNSMNTTAGLNRKMIDELGSKRLKLLWDPCNALMYHEYPTLEVYESVKDILGHIHIKDAVVDTVLSTVEFRPLRRGMISPYLDDLAAALRRDGYPGYVSLEAVYKPEGGDYLDGYRLNLPEFKKIFQ